MKLNDRFPVVGVSLAIAVAIVGAVRIVAQPVSQSATVTGVLGAGATVSGANTALTKGQLLPAGSAVTAPAGTKVFLSQQWDTAEGRCIYWTIINGDTGAVSALGPSPCPVINNRLSLTAAAANQGVTVIADVHPLAGPPQQPVGGDSGLGSRASASTISPLDARLSRELEDLERQQPKPPKGLGSGGKAAVVGGFEGKGAMIGQVPPASVSYQLVCRGGGDLHFTYTPFSNLSPQPQVWISFARASAGVGAQWENLGVLQPGQCSWLDRPVSPAEPERIAVLNVSQFSIQWQRGSVTGIGSSFAYLSALQDAGRYQAFDVYNNGGGFFIATAIGQTR